jgi:hypothetical protein
MKKIKLLFISAFFSMQFLSCSEGSEPSEDSALYFKGLASKVALKGSDSKVTLRGSGLEMDTVASFTGKDIAWYNNTTGELKFKEQFPLITAYEGYSTVDMHVYLNNDSLFSVNLVLTSILDSWIINSPVLLCVGSNYYIKDGYPYWWKPEEMDLFMREKREKNWKAMEPGWSKFIKQLKKEGRYRK